MSYRTILVSLNDVANTARLLDVALKLTKGSDTHIIGLYVTTIIEVPSIMGAVDFPESVYENHRIANERRANDARRAFDETINKEQISAEFQIAASHTTQISQKVIEFSRCANITLTMQGDDDGPDNGQRYLPEQLLMESGRPVLIVPKTGDFKTVGEYPLVAWNGSKEASRAVFDAIPILKKSKEVSCLTVNPVQNSENNPDMAGSEIATSLSREGISVKVLQASSGRDKGVDTTLLAKVHDLGSDLLVMGGYGRSRLREYIFGGATRHVLENSTVPVLMSH